MSYTPYDTSVLVCKDALKSLRHILQVAEKQPNSATFPKARLHEDMQPLTFQVEAASVTIAKVVARLSGTEPVSFRFLELETFADMFKRIDQVDELLNHADKDLINSRIDQTIPLPTESGGTAQLAGDGQIFGFSLPNLFFHVSTAYGILRKEGVPLGKSDYIDSFSHRWA